MPEYSRCWGVLKLRDLSLLDPEAKKSRDVEFIVGDSMQVEKLFPEEFLEVG